MNRYCFIFDLDGTLAINPDRSPYDETKVSDDLIIAPVGIVCNALIAQGSKIIFVSGRTEGCKGQTIEWLKRFLDFGLKPVDLYMRKVGDRRNDAIVKKEIYETFIKPNYEVLGIFDDRERVCRMWVEEGLFLFNVGQYKANF